MLKLIYRIKNYYSPSHPELWNNSIEDFKQWALVYNGWLSNGAYIAYGTHSTGVRPSVSQT